MFAAQTGAWRGPVPRPTVNGEFWHGAGQARALREPPNASRPGGLSYGCASKYETPSIKLNDTAGAFQFHIRFQQNLFFPFQLKSGWM